MNRSRTLLILPFLAFIALDAEAGERPNHDAWLSTPAPATFAPASTDLGVYIASTEPSRGAPALVILPANASSRSTGSTLAAARRHLLSLRHLYKAGPSAIRGARHRFTHNTGRGAVIVVLQQTVSGIDVFHGDVKVLLDRDQRVRAIAGSPHPAAHAGSARPFALDADRAISLALTDLYPELAGTLPLRPAGAAPGGWHRYELSASQGGLHFRRPARAKKVYFPVGEALEPAYFLEIQAQRPGLATDVYQYVIAADDGRLLMRRDATAYDAYQYRVWADADGDHPPMDGPMIDYTPHPTGVPDDGPTEYTPQLLVSIDGFNSPNDPWLPKDATETVGNNVDAYIDHSNPDGLSDGEYRASLTAPGIFDHIYDVTAEPLIDVEQSMAATTQLFYDVNWMHDYWYDSGFDEAAGNAQENNYDRGGLEGDVLHAQAQDAALEGALNNANMSTPADGESPRMQMYLWSGPTNASVEVNPLGETFNVGNAGFGPKNFDINALITVIDDGEGTLSDGCEPAQNDLNGRIALIDRGDCSFETKVTNAQDAGALGVLIANNLAGNTPPTLGGDNNLPDPIIPSQGISNNAGIAIKAALQNDPQTAHMFRESSVKRDGTIDNMIVAHEWGHYIHNRLVENGSVATRSQGEGWGDFMALHMTLREGDDQDGVYAASTYASSDGYYGIRRIPYSVDTTKNALSFRHISNGEPLPDSHPVNNWGGPNAEVHNAGEIWTTMLWESYIALQKSYEGDKSFDEARRAMADYLVAGMILAPTMPTYTEQRDAILLAIAASNAEDFQTLALAFASRGAGTCAVSPPRNSTDLIGVIEDFELSSRAIITGTSVSDSLLSCDDDGVIDVGELGEIKVDILNAGAMTLTEGATLEVIDADANLVFPGGSQVEIPQIEAQMGYEASIQVSLDDALMTFEPILITLRLSTPDGCEEFIEVELPTVIHGDVIDQSSSLDDVETPNTVWTTGGMEGETIWARDAFEGGHRWHGDDVGRVSDSWIESPEVTVSEEEPLVIAFDHAYSFEYSDNTYWDGGVIEITNDGGNNWEDISVYADPGYPDAINSEANPMDTRPAFVGDNANYPKMEALMLDLGMAFAGSSVKIRFRIGTDAAAGGPGWDIDNIAFVGITNTPFPTWVADAGLCVGGTDTDTDSMGTDSMGTDGTDSMGTDGTDGTDSWGTDGTDSDSWGTDSEGSASDSASSDSDSNSGTGGSASGTGTGTGTGNPADSSSAGNTDSDSATGTDTAGEGGSVSDEGCGCRSDDGKAPPLGLVALGLIVLGRRRRH